MGQRKTIGWDEPAPGVRRFKEMVIRDIREISGGKTMTRNENVTGLATSIALANDIRASIISHFANEDRHTNGAQSTADIAAAATDYDSMIALTTSLLALYKAHNTDAAKGSGWDYHDGELDSALASDTAPTSMNEAKSRLEDIKTKFNTHEASETPHTGGTVAGDEVDAANVSYGNANFVLMTNVKTGDRVFWYILDDGTGDVTGTSAVAGDGGVTFTFSADPQDDAIITYLVARPAA